MSDCATPWTAAYQTPPSMGFSRQEYWSGMSLPSQNLTISYLKNAVEALKNSQSFMANKQTFNQEKAILKMVGKF